MLELDQLVQRHEVPREVSEKWQNMAGWSKLWHSLRNTARAHPEEFSEMIESSDESKLELKDTGAVEALLEDYAAVYQAGVSAARQGRTASRFGKLKSGGSTFWAYVCRQAEKGVCGYAVLVQDGAPERVAHRAYLDDVRTMFLQGAQSYERSWKKPGWLPQTMVAGAMMGLVFLVGAYAMISSVEDRVEQRVNAAKAEIRTELSNAYSRMRGEASEFFRENLPQMQEAAMETFDAYVREHPDALYAPQGASLREAFREIIRDDALMREFRWRLLGFHAGDD